jgi:AraC-like DNA-binding protein
VILDPTVNVVRQAILSLLPHGHPTIDQVAQAVGSSVRTLQRRLAAAGLSHSHLVDEVRFTEARRHLRDPHLRLRDIGWALGYTDPGCFTRAFIRWSGMPPRVYRARPQPPAPGAGPLDDDSPSVETK